MIARNLLAALALTAIASLPAHAATQKCNTTVPTVAAGTVGTLIGGIGPGLLFGGIANWSAKENCKRAEMAQRKPSKHPTRHHWRNPDTRRYQ